MAIEAYYIPPLPLNYKGRAQLLDDVWDNEFAPRTKLRRGTICECLGPVGIESETTDRMAFAYHVSYDPPTDTLLGRHPNMKARAQIPRDTLAPLKSLTPL